jgi:hypothetical protein
MEIHWQGQISQDDLARAIEAHFVMRQLRRAAAILCGLVTLPLLAVWVAAILQKDASLLPGRDLWLVLLSLAPVFLAIVVIVWLPRWSARRAYRANPAFQHPIAGSASPHGLHMRARHSESDLGWDAFDHYLHSGGLVLLYMSTAVFHVFPRRFFGNERDWQTFLELVAEYVPGAVGVRAQQAGTRRLFGRVFVIVLVVAALVALLMDYLQPGLE